MNDTLNASIGCLVVLVGLGCVIFFGYHTVSGIVSGNIHYFTRWHEGFIQWESEPWRFAVGVFSDVFFVAFAAICVWAGFNSLNKIGENKDD